MHVHDGAHIWHAGQHDRTLPATFCRNSQLQITSCLTRWTRKQSCKDRLAKALLPACWNRGQILSSEDPLAASLLAGSGLKIRPNFKLWRPLGKVTPSRLRLNHVPNVKLWSPLGKVTLSSVWSKLAPKVKFWRLDGKLTPARLLSKSWPNVKLWSPLGKVTPSSPWLKRVPNVKLLRQLGKVIPSNLWSKLLPNVKLWRPGGQTNVSSLWSKQLPSVKLWRPVGKITPSSLWLKLWPECQVLQTAWKSHAFQPFVEKRAKCQALKIGHSFQALGVPHTKCEALKTAWQGDFFRSLVETITKYQALKATWQGRQVSGWNVAQISSSEVPLARSPFSLPGWNTYRNLNSEDQVARSLLPASGWNAPQISSFEDHLARSLLQAPGWNKRQRSSSGGNLAGAHLPSSGWNCVQRVKFWRLDGKLTPARLWSKFRPNVKLWRPRWQGHSFQALIECFPKFQALKTAWQGCFFQALVELMSKSKGFKDCGGNLSYIQLSLYLILSSLPLVQALRPRLEILRYNTMLRTNLAGTNVQESVAAIPSMPCSCNVWSSTSGKFMWCSFNLLPFFEGSWCDTVRCTSRPRVEPRRRSLHSSPLRQTTSMSIISGSLIDSTEPLAAQADIVLITEDSCLWRGAVNCHRLLRSWCVYMCRIHCKLLSLQTLQICCFLYMQTRNWITCNLCIPNCQGWCSFLRCGLILPFPCSSCSWAWCCNNQDAGSRTGHFFRATFQ